MEELKPEGGATEAPKPAEAGATSRSPLHIVRPVQPATKLDKTVGVLRTMLPLALKILPLLDGQIGTVVSNLIGPQTAPRQDARTLLPLQDGLVQLEKQHNELRTQVAEQGAVLKHIDEQLEAVRNLTAEAAEAHQNLTAGLKKMRRNMFIVAIGGFVLLTAVITLNVVFWIHLRRSIP
jgi:hypothetical protein